MRKLIIVAVFIFSSSLEAQFTLTGVNSGTPIITPPLASTGPAISITQTSAVLTGTGTPQGSTTHGQFIVGLDTNYSLPPTSLQNLGNGLNAVAISGGSLTGLSCGTTYHYQAIATNNGGTAYGGDQTFATSNCTIPPTPPDVTTSSATNIETTTATINGTVDPNGTDGIGYLEYGLTVSYGNTTDQQVLGSGSSPVTLTVGDISNLVCNTVYHFRAVGINGSGSPVNGSDDNFTTDSCPVSGLLTSSDMSFQGMWRASTSSISSNLSYSMGQVTWRYVTGSPRILYVGRNPTWGSGNAHPGPLFEFSVPVSYGTTVSNAPELTLVRQWNNWESGFYYNSNGVNIGGIWYDAVEDVVWYTIYSTYGGPTDPDFLGATRLNDNGTVTKFGPWKFPLGATEGSSYRMAQWWIFGCPSSVTTANPDAYLCMGAAVGSTNQNGNWGPGLYWFKKPDLNTPGRLPGSSYPSSDWGPLLGYSKPVNPSLAVPAYHARRPGDYSAEPGSGAFYPPSGSGAYDGYWAASLDQMSGFSWIETAAKRGIVTLGRLVSADRCLWYSGNPKTNACPVAGTYYDRGSNAGNSYKSGVLWPTDDDGKAGTEPAGLIYDPLDAIAVMNGTALPASPRYTEKFNWLTLWSAIPLRAGTPAPYGVANYPNAGSWSVFDSPQGQPATAAFDPTAKRLVWVLPSTYLPSAGNYPTFQVWTVP